MSNGEAGKRFLDWLGKVLDDPVEHLSGPTLVGGAALGAIIGLVHGFLTAGIGGAILYALGGVLVGAIAGYCILFLLNLFVEAIPWLFWLGILLLIGLIIGALWGVGKP